MSRLYRSMTCAGLMQVRTLIGALCAFDDMGQASFGDLAAHALLGGPGTERGSHAVSGAIDAEFSQQLRERLIRQRPAGGRGWEHHPVTVAEAAGLNEHLQRPDAQRHPVGGFGLHPFGGDRPHVAVDLALCAWFDDGVGLGVGQAPLG